MKIFSLFTDSQYTFEGKRPYENVQRLIYRHWFIIVSKLLIFTLLALVPLVFWYAASRYSVRVELLGLLNFFFALYYLVWWNGLFYSLTMYLLDTWIITDHRVLDNEQHGLFSRTLSEMSLAKIQDVSVETKGLLPTFLNYGNLEVQTAGAEVKFIFKQIPNPSAVKALLMEAHNQFMAEHPEGTEIHETAGL